MPDFETRIQFKNSESLTFRYDMRNQFTDVTKLAQGLVLNNFSSIQFGEPELQNALSHNLSLTYSSFNLFNYISITSNILEENFKYEVILKCFKIKFLKGLLFYLEFFYLLLFSYEIILIKQKKIS